MSEPVRDQLPDEAPAHVSVIIPTYNEEATIDSVLTELQTLDEVDEIIVVDDGSTDGTAEKVVAHQAVRLINHPYNLGNGAAVKSGMRAATGDVIVLMDGDGQHPPHEIPGLLQYIDRYDMVVGARNTESDSVWHRNWANKVFNIYASYIVGYPVPDLTSGFRAIRADVAREFVPLLPNGFSYPTTLTIACFKSGYTVKYHPFRSPARIGKSKIRPVRDGLRFLLTISRLAVLFVPLKVFLPVSTVLILSGGAYTVGSLIFLRRFSGFGSLIFTIGVFLLLLGMVSEQIALLRFMRR